MMLVLTRRWPIEVSLGSNKGSDQLIDLRDALGDDALDVARHYHNDASEAWVVSVRPEHLVDKDGRQALIPRAQ